VRSVLCQAMFRTCCLTSSGNPPCARLQFPGRFATQIKDMRDRAVLPRQFAMDALQRRYTEPHQPFNRSRPVQRNVCRHGFNTMNALCGRFIKLGRTDILPAQTTCIFGAFGATNVVYEHHIALVLAD
jgi:hypothetical protein